MSTTVTLEDTLSHQTAEVTLASGHGRQWRHLRTVETPEDSGKKVHCSNVNVSFSFFF